MNRQDVHYNLVHLEINMNNFKSLEFRSLEFLLIQYLLIESSKRRYNLQYSLLSDKGGMLAKHLKLKKNLGLIAARVTLIINPEGLIIYAHTSQLGVMGHVRKALKVIKSQGAIA